MPTLHIYLNGEFRWKFTLFDEEVLIGRGHENHIVLSQPDVSRQHAVIREQGQRFVIQDESGKGLQINDQTVSRATLKDGDSIAIKAFRLVFSLDTEDQQPRRKMLSDATMAPQPRRQMVPDATVAIPSVRPAQGMPLEEDDRTQALLESFSVVVIAGPDEGLSCLLQGEVIRVGRSPQNHLILKDASASSFHLEITLKGRTVEIRDLGSTNGTYVEGHRIAHATVPIGSEIKIGKTSLLFSKDAPQRNFGDGLSGQHLNRMDDFRLIEKRVIERSLNTHRGDKKAVAKTMGISLVELNDKIVQYKILD